LKNVIELKKCFFLFKNAGRKNKIMPFHTTFPVNEVARARRAWRGLCVSKNRDKAQFVFG